MLICCAIIQIFLLLPLNVSAVSGSWEVKGGTFRNLSTIQSTKQVSVNDNNFIIDGLNQDLITGVIVFEFDLADKHELIIEMVGADPEANEVPINTYKRKQWKWGGVRKFMEER